ncbi:hypothetical protein GOBAR_AA38404 [Gossypium barbadense]|uniref:Uncharacterized protein n=1 Tax=Gossypium barbadense TaxID=3634 RepID=A0A2P5VU00_GOSBA|nr:hypothetical protein GOBAR_AA38404 [Gossypium barbadense]
MIMTIDKASQNGMRHNDGLFLCLDLKAQAKQRSMKAAKGDNTETAGFFAVILLSQEALRHQRAKTCKPWSWLAGALRRPITECALDMCTGVMFQATSAPTTQLTTKASHRVRLWSVAAGKREIHWTRLGAPHSATLDDSIAYCPGATPRYTVADRPRPLVILNAQKFSLKQA